MKTSVKILALAMAVLMLAAVLVACGGPSGTYGNDTYSLKFSGSKVTVTASLLGISTSAEGTFKMGKDEDGNKTITFDFSKEGSSNLFEVFNGTRSYNQGKDDGGSYIEISGVKCYKK